jgi:hypothetical protein
MVARVICGKSIRGIIAYNEAKVREEKAELIHASKFGIDTLDLSLAQKVQRFEKLLCLNRKVKTNAIHISLNFDPKEKLDKDRLVEITASYMDKIGFGEQPFLLYTHTDAAHPHVHIVTTNIQNSGKRIDLHNIGKVKSESARKEVEAEFKLIKADGMGQKELYEIPQALQKAIYGKAETRRTISNIVREVARTYKFTSLPELNAALKHYNIIADRGFEGTAMFNQKGLAYSILGKDGRKIGIPIKASRLSGKPTLKFLEDQFRVNKILRRKEISVIRARVNSVLNSKPQDIKGLSGLLALQRIDLVIRENKDGRIYGLTYVDHSSRCVVNGSDLGKRFTPKGVFEGFESDQRIKHSSKVSSALPIEPRARELPISEIPGLDLPSWLITLSHAEQIQTGTPGTDYKKRRRKKKKGHKL